MIPRVPWAAAAKQAVKWSALGVDRIRRPPGGVVVLIYHRVGGRSSLNVDLPIAEFAAQMETLATHHRVVTLDTALELLEGESEPADERDPVVITFDDGTADFADLAVPLLARFDLPATLYLATEFVDQRRAFPNDGIPMSWSALEDVQSTGLVTVGSHTHTHALLDRLSPEEVDAELDRADDLIEEHIGRRPRHFAFPKAVAGSSPADRAVRIRYRSAALAGTRPNPYGRTDFHRLARTPIQTSDGSRFFRAKVRGGMGFEDSLRVTANRWRYRDATE